jgi:RHS repeat-associated protein
MLGEVANIASRFTPRPSASGASPAPCGLPAAKHFDPVLGIDIHLEIVPPVVPLPNPFVGFLFDPFDYLPFLGATVFVNKIPRAQAGTAGIACPPHRPWVAFQTPPENECEMFMGSMTVTADGDAMSYMALPVLSCTDLGIPPPPRKKSPPISAMVLPNSRVIAMPMGPPVMVGGPPIVSIVALGFRAAVAGIGKGLSALAKTKAAKKAATVQPTAGDAVPSAKRAVPGAAPQAQATPRTKAPATNKSCGRVGEPVDVVTGAVVGEAVDFSLPEPVLRFSRRYDSRRASERSAVGRGFRHSLEIELFRTGDSFTLVDGDGEPVDLPALRPAQDCVGRDGYRVCRADPSQPDAYTIEGFGMTMRFEPCGVGARAPIVALARGGDVWHLARDPRGHLSEIACGDRRLSVRTDDAGRIAAIMDASGSTKPILAEYRYDPRGFLVSHRDAVGGVSTYAYDDHGRMIRTTDPSGYGFRYVYDAEGRCVRSSGDDGMYDVSLVYDAKARCTTVTWPDGGVWRYRYDACGVLTSIADPHGAVRRFATDRAGRVSEQQDELGNRTRIIYDASGGRVGEYDGLGHIRWDGESAALAPGCAYVLPSTPLRWRFGDVVPPPPPTERAGYDRRGRLQSLSSPHGIATLRYDASGNVGEACDADGRVTRFVHAPFGPLREQVDALEGRTRYTHDFRANVTSVADPAGATHAYRYDAVGRLVEVSREGTRMESYRRDAAGNLIEKLDGAGRPLLAKTVGPRNLVQERRLASGETQRFEYDARGRIVRATASGLEIVHRHGADGRVVADLRDGLGIEHDVVDGRVAASRWLGSVEVRYAYDAGAVTIVDPAGGAHRIQVAAPGRVTTHFGSGVVVTEQYDARGLCEHAEVSRPDGARAWSRRYRYSGEGDLLEVQDSECGVSGYAYDALHRLIKASSPTAGTARFHWDPAGNLLAKPGLAGVALAPGNRLVQANGERVEYDDRHRVARREGPRGTAIYRYDSLDRLVECEIDGERFTATYDPFCRRVSKTWQGRTTTYYWDDARLAAERLPSGTTRIYIYADLASLVPVLFVDVGEHAEVTGVYAILADQRGMPLRALDAAGRTVWSAHAAPFGEVEVAPGATTTLALRMPGHLYDPETGLHYNRFRYYSPALGRYLQPDPLGVMGTLNVYQYCPSPLRAVDLDGLMQCGSRGPGAAGAVSRAGPSEQGIVLPQRDFDYVRDVPHHPAPETLPPSGSYVETGNMGDCACVVVGWGRLDDRPGDLAHMRGYHGGGAVQYVSFQGLFEGVPNDPTTRVWMLSGVSNNRDYARHRDASHMLAKVRDELGYDQVQITAVFNVANARVHRNQTVTALQNERFTAFGYVDLTPYPTETALSQTLTPSAFSATVHPGGLHAARERGRAASDG